jgi:NADPH:quinone reductase
MRAWRVSEFGRYRDVLRWEPCDPPTPPDDGVVVRVAAAGLNFPDILSIAGKYQVKAPLPFSPGMEAVGVVEEVGPKSGLEVGDRVIANHPWGAFAEHMAAPDRSCFRAPAAMGDADAAALVITYQTSYFALVHRAQLSPDEVLLVHGGAGGVGTSAIQLGKALGATVIATAGTDGKLEVCRGCGADHVINYKTDDFVAQVKELTGGRGADVIYDPVGGEVFEQSTRCIAWEGRLLVIGFAGGTIPSVPANRVLIKNFSVVGLHWGNYLLHDPDLVHDTHQALCDMYEQGRIRPVIYREYPLEKLPDALDALAGRDSYGKIVLRP